MKTLHILFILFLQLILAQTYVLIYLSRCIKDIFILPFIFREKPSSEKYSAEN